MVTAVAAATSCTNARSDWRTASREPVGLAPDPADVKEAVVQVYGARTVGAKGLFGVHTWVAVKPAEAKEWTVYEVVGWRLRWSESAIVVHSRPPDARWFGSVPELEVDLPATAIGKDYLGSSIFAAAPSGSGVQLSLGGVFGLAVSAVDGLEFNVLGLNFGISPNGVKLPMVGRVRSSSEPSNGAEEPRPKGLVSGEEL